MLTRDDMSSTEHVPDKMKFLLSIKTQAPNLLLSQEIFLSYSLQTGKSEMSQGEVCQGSGIFHFEIFTSKVRVD